MISLNPRHKCRAHPVEEGSIGCRQPMRMKRWPAFQRSRSWGAEVQRANGRAWRTSNSGKAAASSASLDRRQCQASRLSRVESSSLAWNWNTFSPCAIASFRHPVPRSEDEKSVMDYGSERSRYNIQRSVGHLAAYLTSGFQLEDAQRRSLLRIADVPSRVASPAK